MVERSTLTADDPADRLQTGASAPVDPGRLGVYTALGASVAALPLPWLPDALTRRVRGALVHDIAVRRGLSLTPEARELLAEPSGPDGPRGIVSQALRFFGVKLAARLFTRFGPIGLVWPVQYALRTFVLGCLFDRYLERSRIERAVRIDVDEARRVRRAIDAALARAITVQIAPAEEPAPIDDQRDPTTALVDALIGLAAGVPERLLRRIEVAFDELLAHADG
jgi:hypothetical protein